MTEDERAERARELLEPWLLKEARMIAKGYGHDLKWGDWTEGGFFVRYAGRRVHVDVNREGLEDYMSSGPKDQEVIRSEIRSALETALG